MHMHVLNTCIYARMFVCMHACRHVHCMSTDASWVYSNKFQSLRILFWYTFNLTQVKNGVHCTDLPEDGVLECKFIFKHSFNPFQEAMEHTNHNLRWNSRVIEGSFFKETLDV